MRLRTRIAISELFHALAIVIGILCMPFSVHAAPADPDFMAYESILGQHGSIMLLLDPDTGEIVFANGAAAAFYGYPVEMLQAMRMDQINTMPADAVDQEMQLASTERRNYFLFQHRLANGQIRDVEVYSYPVQLNQETLLFSVINDVTEKLALERQVHAKDQRMILALSVTAFILLLGIILLHRSFVKYKKALQNLDALFDGQKKIAAISLEFSRAESDQYDLLFKKTLDDCGPMLKIDRSLLAIVDLKRNSRTKAFEWYRSDPFKTDVAQAADLQQFPWLFDQLKTGKTVYIDDVALLPPEAAAERAYFSGQGIRARCVIPIIQGGRLIAVWGLDAMTCPLHWQAENDSLRNVLAGVFTVAIDRKLKNDETLFWRNLLEYVIQNDPNSIAVLDRDMNYMFTSHKYLSDFRINKVNIVGSSHYQIFPDIPDRWRQIHQKVLQGHVEKSEEEAFARQDGSVDYTRYYLRPWFLPDQSVGGIILYLEVINERKKREMQLQDSEERFRLLVETAPDAIFLAVDDTIAYANPAAVRMLKAGSLDSLIGKSLESWVQASYKTAVQERIRILLEDRKPVPPMEQVYVAADGTEIPVEVTSTPIQYQDVNGALIYVRDITQRKQREEKILADMLQVQHQERLKSIGTLASGVAHEINNPIMGIINYAQLIIDEDPTDPDILHFAREIMAEGTRISEITKDLLFYSRQQKQAHSPADINDIIRHTLSLIQGVLKKDQIEVIIQTRDDLPPLKCRSQQVQQILMNLITNARDTLNEKYPDGNPDKVIILTTDLFTEEGRRWIRITVEDHGQGIAKENQDKLFDPFFTTKPREIGTGLGLPISYGLALDHHGKLYFETAAGQYTRFHLSLPVDNGWDIEKGE